MPLSLAQKFINIGMPSVLATEYAQQIISGVFSSSRLQEASMPTALAAYLASSLSAGTYVASRAMQLGLTDAQARLTQSTIPTFTALNFKSSNTVNIRSTIAAARTGASEADWDFIGSSTPVGVGAGTGAGSLVGARANVFHATTASVINAAGARARWNAFWGCQGYPTGGNLNLIDPRISFGPGWTNGLGSSLGGPMFTNTTTTADGVIFTPVGAFDRITVNFSRFSGGGLMDLLIDGASVGNVNTAGTPAQMIGQTFNVTLGVHTVEVRRISGSDSFMGAKTWNSSALGIEFNGMGFTGSTVADWTDTASPRSPINALQTHAPKATFIMLGNNDVVAGVAPATYKTSKRSLIDVAKLSGDCVIISPQYVNTTLASQSAQDAYKQVDIELSAEADVPMISVADMFGTYADGSVKGFYADSLHLSRKAHNLLGTQLGRYLLGLN